MTPVPAPDVPDANDDGGDGDDDRTHVHLLMEGGEDRRLLADWLDGEYEVTLGEPLERFDLCVVDGPNFRGHREALAERKEREDPVFLPVLLIAAPGDGLHAEPAVWDHVDDVIETPIGKAELRARLSNLIQRRRTSTRLAERERALERTVSELELKERAMDAAPNGVTITDPGQPDNPVVYANAAFERITGYDEEDALGRNMRFLQGPATDDAAVEALREGIAEEERASATLVNYRADGTRFWNRVDVAPVRDETGELINYVGFQTDVTDERIREQRLSVLNRLMRHNLSNDLNIIEGYADNLMAEVEDPDRLDALRRIKGATGKLKKLGEDVSRIERVLERCRAFDDRVNVGHALARACEAAEEAYPEAEITLDVEGGPWYATGNCLEAAFAEVIENAVEHNDAAEPTVAVSVGPVDDATDRIEVRVVDDGPGIPDGIVEVLRRGRETQLKHGDGLGLWLVYWVVTLLGGDVAITSREVGGTAVTLALPTSEAEGA